MRSATPQLHSELRDGDTGFTLEPSRRLDLDVGPEAELGAQLSCLLERGHALTAVFRAEPSAGVQARESCVGCRGDAAPSIRSAIQGFVMDEQGDFVRREHYVELHAAKTHCRRLANTRQGVLGRERAAAPMDHYPRMRPGSMHVS